MSTPPSNVPALLTSFVGRARERDTIKRLLATTRLVALTGSGGCGKTRLAVEVAAELARAGAFADGVWLVELAALSDPALVPHAAASVLGVRETSGQTMTETLAGNLRSKDLLLVLDNCEHLVAGCAALAETLLTACPGLRILATSREALRVAGETVRPVPPLSLPRPARSAGIDAFDAPPLAEMNRSEAARLFVERASAVRPGFSLDAGRSPTGWMPRPSSSTWRRPEACRPASPPRPVFSSKKPYRSTGATSSKTTTETGSSRVGNTCGGATSTPCSRSAAC